MCRAGGRRCEHNWSQAQRDARNAKRRALYAAQRGGMTANAAAPATSVEAAPEVANQAPANARASVLSTLPLNDTVTIEKIQGYEAEIERIIARRASHSAAIEATTDDEIVVGALNSDIQNRNREIIEVHDKIFRTLDDHGVDPFDTIDAKSSLDSDIEVIGEEKVNLNIDYRDSASVRALIRSAGIKYPMSWDEMGSSQKDMWEDRMVNSISRTQARTS